MSDRYTENDTDAGYQNNYMGGTNTKKRADEKEKRVYLEDEKENENDRDNEKKLVWPELK
jgi:hypothetical protein